MFELEITLGDLVQLLFYRVGTYMGFDIKMEFILSIKLGD